MEAVGVAVGALQRAGITVVGDYQTDAQAGVNSVAMRASVQERRELITLSALAQGAASIARREVPGSTSANTTGAVIETAVRQIVDNPELYKQFQSYYGGLGWGVDQERFTQILFEYGTPYDRVLVEQSLSGSHVHKLIEDNGTAVDGSDWREIFGKTAEELLQRFPQLDYRQLDDPAFVETPAGQQLAAGYARICGLLQAERHKRYPPEITEEGTVTVRPIIPLSRFPVIEALMTEEALMSRPKAKYDFGRHDVVDLILCADSVPAQQAIVQAVTTRLPKEERYVWDGPDEFSHKLGVIRELAYAYEHADDPGRKSAFKNMVLEVLDAYTGNGAMTHQLCAENSENGRAGLRTDAHVRDVKNIVINILAVGLASPDADEFLARALPNDEHSLATGVDPFALDRTDLAKVLFGALSKVGEGSYADVFERLGQKVFQDDHIATALQYAANLKIEAARKNRRPEVMLARKVLQAFHWSIGEKTQEQLDAEKDLDIASEPAEEAFGLAQETLNNVLIGHLTSMVENGSVRQLQPEDHHHKFFKELLGRISYGDMYTMRELPPAYHALMELGRSPLLAEDLKAGIVWKMAEETKYVNDSALRLLPTMIVDGYRVMLGEQGSLRLPSYHTASGLSALAAMAHRTKIFKFATEEQLQTLKHYHTGMMLLGDRYLTASLADGQTGADEVRGADKEQAHYLHSTLQEMSEIAGYYREFLYLEDVKEKPEVYYPWVLKELVPFWRKMQWEVSPGNRPTPDVSALYNTFKNLIDHSLVFQDAKYPENFDVFLDGNLDALIIEGYRQMVVPHDIKYVGAVYHEGLSFMLNAVLMMPEPVVQQFRDKYGKDSGVVQYIERNRKQFNERGSGEWG